jgi:hypothetical protein
MTVGYFSDLPSTITRRKGAGSTDQSAWAAVCIGSMLDVPSRSPPE